MESPTRLSQSQRFFRFGRLSKMSRKSSSAYSNHSSYSSTASVAHPMDTLSATDVPLHHHHHHRSSSKKSSQNKPPIATEYAVSDIYQQLNHRSASMSTLPSNMPSSSAYNILPGYIGDLTANHYGMNQPRLSQLQTLEAKMASIAVSLSGGGRRVAAGSSTGVSTLNHHSTNGGSSNNVKSGSSPSTDTLRSSGKQSVVSNNSNNKQPIRQQQQQQHSEIDLLRKIIQDKDALIQTLQQKQQQISSNVNSVAQSNAMNGNSISSRATSSERQHVERRLALINRDIDQKRGAIKNIRLSLQQTNVSDNIDARIRQAEIEYQLEREETNLLNLQDEKRQLLLRFGSGAPIQQQQQWGRQQLQLSSLFRIVHGHAPLVIVADKIDYDAQNPNFKLQWAASDNNRSSSTLLLDTCTVQWAREDINLKAGDRVLEINGEPVPGQETKIVLQTGFVEVVAVRQCNELTQRTERLVQERDALKADNLRLKHRISYLEEVRHDKELLGMTDAADAPLQQQQQRGKAPPPPKVTQQQQQIINDSMSSSGESQYRSEVHIQSSATTPVRQKPPRTSKLKASSASSTADQSEVMSNGGNNNNNNNNKRLHSTLDAPSSRRTAVADEPINNVEVGDTNSVGRIKTSSIVDRHFGHVIRVTHHHHPMAPPPPQSKPPSSSSSLSSRHQHRHHQIAQAESVSDLQSVASYDSFIDGPPPPSSRGHPLRHGHQQRHHQVAQSMDTLSSVSSLRHFNSHRSPPSPTRSEVQSVASMDMERRHLGYISDEQTISSSSISYKKPSSSKPVPPRKPSFLYLNRASSLQSVNGGVIKMSTAHSNKQFDTDDDETGWNNNTAPSSKSSLKSSNPLAKWNILSSSSRVKNADN